MSVLVQTRLFYGGAMYNRRQILVAVSVAPFLGLMLPGQSKGAEDLEAEINAWMKEPNHVGYFDPPEVKDTQRGSLILAPSDPKVRQAATILSDVPVGLAPIETARWMMDKIPSSFTMEWPPDTPSHKMPANPLIVAFFAATKTEPYAGDETAWCAAFVCWVLKHCGKPYTRDAGSRSFRDFAKLPRTDSPKKGDLVVFKHLSKPKQGHVAFFDGFANDAKTRVWCLGGNQGNRISRKPFTTNVGDLRLDSYHSVA
ncbi:CHAP domain-containing protein [Rhizobium leguminosarum]|uniref:CHAP domain-containing protein n=1 Tax=Rhizobium leguminosarum TaxID=384 RepID=UPI0010310326|nr:CHAP domain-containing protein [Rhizobium leguminosarum]TAY14026.1 CHAP domain-containing protein [Rhizobium leguminosarum]